MHQVFLDGISDNMASLVQSDKYGVISTYYTTTNGLYVIQLTFEAYTLQNNTKINRQIISAGKLFSRHNISAPYNKVLISIGNNSHCNRIS